MSSVDNENPFGTYNYKDCSLGICSIYCPQFCYLIFPPPPPTDDGSSTPFSPLIISIIGVLASFFLLVSYYTIVTRYCKRRHFSTQNEDNRNENDHDQYHVATPGLDEALIKTIPVRKYREGDGLIEGTDCAVCLSEFQENEALRLLPKCRHAFHLPCIDKWLKSQSNCPLCRASVVALAQAPPSQVANAQTSSDLSMNSYEVRRPNDLILVVDDQERNFDERVVCVHDDDENLDRREHVGFDQEILICDILRFEEIYEDLQVEKFESLREVGSSKGGSRFGVRKSWDMGLLRSPVAMKRSISAGRFMLTGHDHKGKNSVVSS